MNTLPRKEQKKQSITNSTAAVGLSSSASAILRRSSSSSSLSMNKKLTLLSAISSTCSLILCYGGYAACDFIRINTQLEDGDFQSYGLFCSFPNIDKIYILCRSFAIFSLLSGFITTICLFSAYTVDKPASFPCLYIVTSLLQLGSLGIYFTKEVSGYKILYKSVGIGTWVVLSSFIFQAFGITLSLMLQRMEMHCHYDANHVKEMIEQKNVASLDEEGNYFWNVVSSTAEESSDFLEENQSVSTITENSVSNASQNSSEFYSNYSEICHSLSSSSLDDSIFGCINLHEEEETVRQRNGVSKIVWIERAKTNLIQWPSDESTGDSVPGLFGESV